MTTPTEVDEVDGSDEADHDAQEIALGAAIAALLLAELLPGPASFFSGIRSWNNRIEAALGPVIRGFLQRSASDVAAESGRQGASAIALQTAEEIYPRVLSWIQERSYETLQNLTDDKLDDATLAGRVTVAAENLARGAAVFAKSDVREQTVGRLGAVWKIWRSRHDDRVRATHHLLDGEKVPYGGKFVSESGALLRFPGDPEAPIGETANCRCHLVYRLRPKDMDFSDA